ncbi:hypothetical protein OEV98_04230 [Caldibacillus lycopersici]|uniref:Uncharacterized protein n=1 Tax=Perspicuibacillus lycopersici TaxID=1325689 RepID=A0AAE3ISQ9_9BACI|nr:hypothetical protein [Perspicuibacillus lycopersici]MCU9612754.1 hypothetical protein [Perspicuibacillus lycopersici]
MRTIAAFFSLFMPGCGQFYNGNIFRGIVFIVIEHFDNIFGRINHALYLDLNGYHREALSTVDFQYSLFYPCFYAYCVWDAWFYAKSGGDKVKSAIPYLIAAFTGTMGTLFASRIPIPTFTVGFVMALIMLTGIYLFRKE